MEHVAKREAQRKTKWGGIDGPTQSLGFGDHSGKTYKEAMAKNPKYAEYLLGESMQDRLAMKKFADWAKRGGIAIVEKGRKAEFFERWGLRRNGRSL